MVVQRDYQKAVSANEGRDGVISLVAAPASGGLYSLGRAVPFLVAGLGYVVQLVALRFVRADLRPTGKESGRSVWADFGEGCALLWSRRDLRVVTAVLAVLNLSLVGVFAYFQLWLVAAGTRPTLIGLFDTALGVGAIVGSAVSAVASTRVRADRIAVLGIAWFPLAMIPVVAAPGYWTALTSQSLLGLALPVMNATLLGYIFATTEHKVQGRMHSLVQVVSSSLAAFAPVLAGYLAGQVSVRVGAGTFAGLMVVCALWAALSSTVRGLRIEPETDPAQESDPKAG